MISVNTCIWHDAVFVCARATWRYGSMTCRLPLLLFMVFMGFSIIRSFTRLQRARISLPFSGVLLT